MYVKDVFKVSYQCKPADRHRLQNTDPPPHTNSSGAMSKDTILSQGGFLITSSQQLLTAIRDSYNLSLANILIDVRFGNMDL